MSFQVEPVKRDDNPVDDLHLLSDTLPPTRSVLTPPKTVLEAWGLSCQRVLVRSEYGETEEAARLSNNGGTNAFMVLGQPGIGVSPSPPVTHRI